MGFLVRKSKRKKANLNLEFVSPYPLEDCVWQLQNFPGVGEWFPVKTNVELAQVDEETWAFKITKSYYDLGFLLTETHSGSRSRSSMGFDYPRVLAEGQLRATPSETTLVVGVVIVTRKLSFSCLILAGIFIAILMAGVIPNFAAAPIIAIVLSVVISILAITSIFGSHESEQRFANAMKGHIKGVLGN